MKALSIKQPWANMIASGKKSIETRLWKTHHRGELLIVSSATPKIYPAGCAIAVVTLIDCRMMIRSDEIAACCLIYPGAFSWVLDNVRKIRPVPIKGQLGIYTVDIDPHFL
jgi:hypothetical protein